MDAHEFRRLLLRHKNGDAGAFETLYELCNRKLISSAFLFLQDRDHAVSVADDILIKLYNEPEKYCEISNPNGWLFISARNGAINLLKKMNVRRQKEVTVNIESSVNPIAAVEERLDYYDLLRCFTREEQRLIVWRVDYGLSNRELASKTNLTVRQIKWKFKKIKSVVNRIMKERK